MRALIFALCMLLPLAACTRSEPVKVENAWARASIGNAPDAAVFMTITAPAGDRLLRASTVAAARTDLMTMEARGDTMGMVYVETIEIPPGEPVHLAPHGLHVWLAGVKQPLVAGQTIPLTLTFEKAGELGVTVSILSPSAPAPSSHMEM